MAGPFNYPHSPHHHHQHHAKPRNRHADGWGRGHRMLVGVAVLLLLVAASAVLYSRAYSTATPSERPSRLAFESGTSTPLQPADQFMHSIITEDGALGWHQLCPSLQAQLSMNALVQLAQAQRTALAQYGVRLTMKFVGTQPQRDGGVSHVYIVTAHWPSGTTQTRTYIVLTQRSGCVEDVQIHE
jgi:hypothetical protein